MVAAFDVNAVFYPQALELNGDVEQTVAFAERLLNYECLRNDSGSLLVAKNAGYAPTQYHGEVIWSKQSAIAIGGLRKHYLRAKKEG